MISHQDCRKGAETLAPPKLKTAAAHIVTMWIQLPSSAWACQAIMLFWLIMNLNRVLSESSPQSLSIYHASLDKAEWCFPPALTCFRNADLVKASPSHFFFDIKFFYSSWQSKVLGTDLIDTQISCFWNNFLLIGQLFYFILMGEKNKCILITDWEEKKSSQWILDFNTHLWKTRAEGPLHLSFLSTGSGK